MQTLSDDQRRLEIEIERSNGRHNAHEEVCTERYGIIRADIAEIKAAVKSLVEAKGRTPWWLRAGIVGLCGVVVTLVTFLASQLWSTTQALQQAKIDQLQARPAANVTVQAPPAQPAAVYPGPILPANP